MPHLQQSIKDKRSTIFLDDKRDGLPVGAERQLLVNIFRARAVECLTHISELLVDEIRNEHSEPLVSARDEVVGKLWDKLNNNLINSTLAPILLRHSQTIWPTHFGTTKERAELLLAFNNVKNTTQETRTRSVAEQP